MRAIDNELNIEMTKGDTLAFGIEILELGSAPDSIFFTVKKNFDDDTILIQKTLQRGITPAGENKYRIRVAPSETEELEIGKYYYDIEITKNGDTYTVAKGILTIEYEVTSNG